MTDDACLKAVKVARRLEREALDADPISMTYSEVRVVMNAQEIREISDGIERALARRNQAEILILELLHVLACSNPHAELVREKLSGDNHVFDRASDFLGVDLKIEGAFGATNG